MTDRIRAAAEAVASRGTRITAVNPEIGPESIEGYYDEALAVPGAPRWRSARAEARGVADAHVIACFDDTGLDAARALARAPPVVGLGEAAVATWRALVAGALFRHHHAARAPFPPIEQNAGAALRPRLALLRGCAAADDRRARRLEDKDSGCPRPSIAAEIDGRKIPRPMHEAIVLRLCRHGGPGGGAVRSSRAAGRGWRRRRGDARRVARPTRPQDVEAGGLCGASREGHPGIPDRPTAPS